MKLDIDKQPSFPSLQQAADWLAATCHETLDLQQTLRHLAKHQIIPQEAGGQVVIARHQDQIKGVILLRPHNAELLIEAGNASITTTLFKTLALQDCPRRVFTSGQVKPWLKPLLLDNFALVREHDQLVMTCQRPPSNGQGRWATQHDRSTLDRYAQAYLAERGSGNPFLDWTPLLEQKRVAVLEECDRIVSFVKRGRHTPQYARVLAPFTFSEYRRKGYAYKLLAFFVGELLRERSAVHLFVDDDNFPAIALYQSLGFQPAGHCYTAYFEEKAVEQ